MKKTLAMLLVLALVAPAMAVTFTASDAGSKVLKIDYTLASGEVLRGLALKLTRTTGDMQVANGSDVVVAPFNTFIDYAFSNAGYAIGDGHPVANPAAAGVAALPASAFSISVGFLDQAGNQAGIAANGSITVQLTGDAESCFDIELDTLRGGVVGDNVVAPAAGWKISQCVAPGVEPKAVKDTAPFFADWQSFGEPACWAFRKNCKGDADGLFQSNKQGKWAVGTNDLNILLPAFQVMEAPAGPGIMTIVNGICADFDHAAQSNKQGKWRVGTNDLNILLTNWQKMDPAVPDCDMTNYNFWTN
ncbi:MAG TPA: hypothetical protein PKB02_18535 [Anaerohalosphaeraceae bacterium]|nr:hypothetical protein [Anaerohalosphaeraceae bacterium]